MRFLSLAVLFFCSSSVFAQNVGIGTITPDSNALLHIDVGNNLKKGLIVSGEYNPSSSFPNFLNGGSLLAFFPGKSAFRVGRVDFNVGSWTNDYVGLGSVAMGRNSMASGENSTAIGYASFSGAVETVAIGTSAVANAQSATAIGYGNNATGQFSNAFGMSSTASGYASVTLGRQSIASDTASTSFGGFTVASGKYAVASGFNTTASGAYSIATGTNTKATGNRSLSLGNNTLASGPNSVAAGDYSIADAAYSIAMGWNNVASGYASTALGYDVKANGNYSVALGQGTVAKGAGSLVVGLFNDSVLVHPQSSSIATTPLFIVGNGNFYNDRSNAFLIRKDGRIGVGTNDPATRLHITNDLESVRLQGNSNFLSFYNQNNGYVGYLWNRNNNSIDLGTASGSNFPVFISPGLNTAATFLTNGNVGIGTLTPAQKLSVVGNITATGTITSSSDIRFKTNVQPLAPTLTSVLGLKPITYQWKKDFAGYTDTEQLGFSAQEVEKLFPQLVLTDAQGYKSVDYGRLTPVLVQAIKEQQQEISDLKTRLERLEKMLLKN